MFAISLNKVYRLIIKYDVSSGLSQFIYVWSNYVDRIYITIYNLRLGTV